VGEEMFKVMVVNSFGNSEIKEMPIVPRIGDTLPLFYNPAPKVNGVVLLPHLMESSLMDKNLDALVTVE
jgi:hypothetical protein